MRRSMVLMAVALVTAGCASFPNPFVRLRPDYTALPEEAMRQKASEIEAAIRAGTKEAVFADESGIVVNTPEILQAIRTRATRQALLDEFLDSGFGYETSSGLVEIRRSNEYKKATTRRERDKHAMLVMGENSDRWALYEGILRASRFPARSLSAIQQIFYEARLPLLESGQRYETAEGRIEQK